jgi:ubiquinone/menaquinone biosynthesis C-methylase UbiE
VSKEFFNSRAATWDEKAAERNTFRLESIVARLDIKAGATVLDAGAGTGVFAPYLMKKIGSKGILVCLDYAEEMLKIARAKSLGGNISFLCADIENSRLPDKSFDVVVCYSVFPHFHDKPKALKEIYRLLKQDGKLFICHTSSRHAINEIHRSLPDICGHLIPENGEMRRMLTDAGFGDADIADGADDYLVSALKAA